MEIIYGYNGSGKTKFKNDEANLEKRVLTSNLQDWIFGDLLRDNDKKITISENINIIAKKESELKSILVGSERPQGVNSSIFTKYLDLMFNGFKINNYKTWLKFDINNFSSEIPLDINQLVEYASFKEKNDWNLISNKEMNNALAISLINEKISKTKLKKIENGNLKEIENGNLKENTLIKIFNDLIIEYDNKMEYFINLENFNENILKEVKYKVLKAILNNENKIHPNDEYAKSIIRHIHSLDNFNRIKDLAEEIHELNHNKLIFQKPRNNFIDFNSTINGWNTDELIITSETPLSSGQRTFLVLQLMLSNENKEIILDDVLETLDENLVNNILEKILHMSNNITLLTHDLGVSESANNIAKSLSLKEPSYYKLNLSGDKIISNGTTWHTIIPKIWNNCTSRGKYERELIKLISRYNAKIGIIYLSKNLQSISMGQDSITWEHWKESSQFFFHYHPNIDFKILNSYFTFLNLTTNISSIQLIKEIRNKNNKFLIADEIVLSISGINKLLLEIEKEMINEKNVYDSFEADCLAHDEWDKKMQEVYNSISMSNGIALNRKRNLIHSLDKSPLNISK